MINFEIGWDNGHFWQLWTFKFGHVRKLVNDHHVRRLIKEEVKGERKRRALSFIII